MPLWARRSRRVRNCRNHDTVSGTPVRNPPGSILRLGRAADLLVGISSALERPVPTRPESDVPYRMVVADDTGRTLLLQVLSVEEQLCAFRSEGDREPACVERQFVRVSLAELMRFRRRPPQPAKRSWTPAWTPGRATSHRPRRVVLSLSRGTQPTLEERAARCDRYLRLLATPSRRPSSPSSRGGADKPANPPSSLM